MRGIIFALLGGAFITLQSVANARISQGIGTWQAAALTQFTGFVAALIILLLSRNADWKDFRKANPLYLSGGAYAAVIIFSNVTAVRHIGVTLTVALVLIAQLALTFLMDRFGWFGLKKQRMKLPQFIGLGMMVAGVVILKF
ncbi:MULTISPECIES: DMT family transporter [Paenibacillus]|jgi:transporter family-2 protein|uniref:DMT family transporter n=1 Tax=Paenibacillus azoreducens TaxID=116718 RepID=A0A919Y6S2_9BACL|nr:MULTISPECIES: DMT family transporter [Paenibacillus]MBE9916165.1 DMT family transporter [Paenibacillus donghaensis]GIO45364.1 hypothetical protein J34TS1_01290 [Paenibacillus azoreducens]